jgi:flagella basal body P-ring formation protein FlgA
MVALQAGAVGEFIELENPQSGRKRYGQIQSDGTVRLGGPEIQKNLVAGAKVGP